MSLRLHEVEGVNRTKTVRFYPFVLTSEERDEGTCYGYCNEYQPHAVKRMFDHKNGMLYDMRWDEAGNLGQVSMAKLGEMFERGRFLFWTEDNRMHAAVDEKYFSYYVYDHSGERRLKLTGINKQQDVCQRLRTPQNKLNEVSNADLMATYTVLNEPTLYPSAYMVLNNKGYTNVTEVESRASSLALPRCSNVTERKHYYAGTDLCASREQSQACLSYAETKQSVRSNRVAARLGGGGLSYDATCVTDNGEVAKRSDKLFWEGLKALNEHKAKPEDFKEMNLVDAKGKEVDWHKKIDLDKLAMSWQLEAKLDPGKIHSVIADNAYPAMSGNTRYENEPDVYFYHSDHLGGASWITDGTGKPVQHLQYLPFGEPYVNQHSAGYQERYTFTGKERDEETGYGYFGARYMDYSMMTMWLSVDPMADKYPNISPYNYCMWNPIVIVDPDGMDSVYITKKGKVARRKSGGHSTFIQIDNTWKEVPMPGKITQRPTYSEDKGLFYHTNTEDVKYSQNDYYIAAATGYFNYERSQGKLVLYSDGGHEICANEVAKIPYLSPSLVKAIAMQESFCGIENEDILQQNNTGDWGEYKTKYGLSKDGPKNMWRSLCAGIRILAAKGFKGTFKKDGSCYFKGWGHAVKKYNGGGNKNYFRFVNEMYHEATGLQIK